jgi:hypothetical protein
MNGNGRNGNNRRRHRDKERERDNNFSKDLKKRNDKPRFDKNQGVFIDRPKWTSPKTNTDPLPVLVCS